MSLPSPWTFNDIGSPGVAGSASYSGGTFTINGSGTDIYGTGGDKFGFVWAQVTPQGTDDVTLTVRVASQQNTSVFAKTGLFVRAGLGATDDYVMKAFFPANGHTFQSKIAGSFSDFGGNATGVPPYWMRITLYGSGAHSQDTWISSDGVTWTDLQQSGENFGGTFYIGMGVCSHDNANLCASTFDNVTLLPSYLSALPVLPPAPVRSYRWSYR